MATPIVLTLIVCMASRPFVIFVLETHTNTTIDLHVLGPSPFLTSIIFFLLTHPLPFSVNHTLYLFSSTSHAWHATPFTYTWKCLFDKATYPVHHLLIFLDRASQLRKIDDTAIQLPYLSVQWIEFALFLDTLNSIPGPQKNETKFVSRRCDVTLICIGPLQHSNGMPNRNKTV